MANDLVALLESDAEPDALLSALMPALGMALDCDRCVLFLRDPHSRMGWAPHRWQRKPEFALTCADAGWKVEPDGLVDDDPMFELALRDPAALYIEDVLTADQSLVNGPYEVENFGHQALVHAPIYHDGQMYGILEPCVMGRSRDWTPSDRATVAKVQARIGLVSAAFVAANLP
ncbi:MAG: GAF domain-containing protein [Alphaproteobacteria bacterium]|jgi:GAF domain-containing protein